MPLGRTIGIGANGAVSNLSPSPKGGIYDPRRELRRKGAYDIVHVHEPLVPLVGWSAVLGSAAPTVGTFHAYSTRALPNRVATAFGARLMFNHMAARIAVSEAAAWTGRRWYGGRYEIVPNGVDIAAAPTGPKPPSEELRVALRRPRRGAQGAADPARRLRRPGRARALQADRDRGREGGGPALPRRPRDDALHRPARPGLRRGALAPAARRRRALRTLARRRELRDGPHRGLRRRHTRDRLGDRRLQRRRQRRRRRRPRAAGRPAAPRRGAAARLPRARSPAGDGGGRARERRALWLAAGGGPRHRGLRAGDRGAASR